MTSEELASTKEEAFIHFQAGKLDKKDLFGKSDPFFIVSKSMPNGQVRVDDAHFVFALNREIFILWGLEY